MKKANLLAALQAKNLCKLTITKLDTVQKMGYDGFNDLIEDLKELADEGKIRFRVESILDDDSCAPLMECEMDEVVDIDDFDNEIDNLKAITVELI